MAIPLTVNGVTFQFPQQFDKNWGPSVTNWAQAVTNGLLQKSGGSFPLTAEVDFGASFGIKVLSIKSEETNIAQTGFLRLANASTGLVWRNSTNTTDLPLTVNASNQLTFNGVNVGATTSLTNTHILVGDVSNQPADVAMSGDATITNTGVVTIANNAITNVKVDPSAGIALSKLASTSPYFWYAADSGGVLTPLGVTASRAVVSDVNGLPSASSTTSTEIGYVSGVTSSIQTQLNAVNSIPVGTLLDFAGTVAPSGYLLCDGSVVSQTTYAGLYAVIGSTWDTGGEGAGNFRLPSLSRRTSIGSGGVGTGTIGNAVGNIGGAETVTPTQVSHTHTENSHTHTHSHKHALPIGNLGATGYIPASWPYGTYSRTDLFYNWGMAGNPSQTLSYYYSDNPDNNTTSAQSDTGMSSTTPAVNAVSVIQPSAVVLKIIKY